MTKIIDIEQFTLECNDPKTNELFRELADRVYGDKYQRLLFASAEAAEAAARDILAAQADGHLEGVYGSGQYMDAAYKILSGCENCVRETRRSGPFTIEQDKGGG